MEHHAPGLVAQGRGTGLGVMEAVSELAQVPTRLLEARADETASSSSSPSCTTNSDQDTCEKPVGSKTFTLPIVLGVVLPIAGALIVFYILHRRHLRKQRLEDLNDRHASMDFGLGDVQRPNLRGKKNHAKATTREVDMREKPSLHAKQQSMDMMLDSPYLLPPELQSSRESLHSLSRTIHQHEDPYRPVTQAYGDNVSIRSVSRLGHDNASMYTTSSHGPSRMQDLSAVEPNGPLARVSANSGPYCQGSLPPYSTTSSPPAPLEKDLPVSHPTPPPEVHLPMTTSPPPIEVSTTPTETRPDGLMAPAPAINRDSSMSTSAALRQSNNYLSSLITSLDGSQGPLVASPTTQSPVAGSPPAISSTTSHVRQSPSASNTGLPANPRPIRKESIASLQKEPLSETSISSGLNNDALASGIRQPAAAPPPLDLKRLSRYSLTDIPEHQDQTGLAAPGFDPRRISVGFRPLPPDTIMENDNPEDRANRIRSFYKEYFDENKQPPAQHQYYEDYDQNYLGDAGYFDQARNNFVMPYAQPVTRRAMTPPPRAPRFQGPARAMHGSMGGMSPGGRRTPQMYPNFRDGSRASSAASNRGRPGPARPLPPPSALNSLPTPSKLKDDSFALMSAVEFAPPQTFRDRAAGRSESPLGERRPYSPAVPAFTPVASSYDELAAMPSPHMLRKSGTFTALDFAPPKRFKDSDSMSDSGSIRSHRSNVSAAQTHAIRTGAYRVSRIPAEVVFTKDDLATTLKPQWDMRGPTSSVRDY